MTNAQLELDAAELQLKRASAARAEEEAHERKEALRAGIATGKELEKEYAQLDRAFRVAEQATIRRSLALSILNERIAQHTSIKPDVLSDFANEEEMAEWAALGERLSAEHSALFAEIAELGAERDRLRLPAVRAFNALEHQRAVVRNLRERIEDVGGERMLRGWIGGVSGI
jgi:hypothetical protein